MLKKRKTLYILAMRGFHPLLRLEFVGFIVCGALNLAKVVTRLNESYTEEPDWLFTWIVPPW